MTKRDIVEHLERELGPIQGGFTGDGLPVAYFPDQPHPGVTTSVTLGLSRTPLPMPDGRLVRLELLFSAYDSFSAIEISGFLCSFADYIVSQNRALVRGDVVGPSDPLFKGVTATAVYATHPVHFSETLWVLEDTSPPTVIVWVMPLPGVEAAFIKTRGWDEYESLLELADPDLWDPNRKPIF